MVAPGMDQTMKSLHVTSRLLGSLMISIFIAGFIVGPLFLGPLSELYGRVPVVVLSNYFMCAWLLGCALAQNMTGLIIMRFLAGPGASAAMVIAPAVAADLYPLHHRAAAT